MILEFNKQHDLGKLHDELLGAGLAPSYVEGKDDYIKITYTDIVEILENEIDVHDEVIGTKVAYYKITRTTVPSTEEGQPDQIEETKEPYAWEPVAAAIAAVIQSHDPTPRPVPETLEEKVARLEAEKETQVQKITQLEADNLTATEGVITLYEMLLSMQPPL